MSLSFLLDEMNADFLPDLGTRWGVEFDKERYTLINPSIQAITKGKSVSAVLQFFIDLGGHYLQDEAENESRTALNAYTELAQGTGYTFHLVDSFPATTLSYQKNMSKTERFHYYNKRYGVEFVVSGTNVYLYRKIGSHRPEVRIDEDLNVKDATVEIDDANFFTWCKCYYDKIDDIEGGAEEYRHEVVYADQGLIEQYGEIEGPAIYQGSIKDEQVMLDFAKSTQEESLKVSHSVTLADLRQQGYEEFIFRAGDTIRLSLSSINTTVDIRIMEIDETFDVNGELTGLTLTLGNYDPVDAYKNSRDAVLLDLEDWIRGRKTIPSNMLENAIQRASDIINGDTDSVMEYRKDRLIGHHDKNTGNNVQLNVSGLEFVRNGVPRSALTYEGLVVDETTTGMLNSHNVRIEGTEGRFLLDGDMFRAVDYNNSDRYTEITPQKFLAHKSAFELIGYDGRQEYFNGIRQYDLDIQIQQFNNPSFVEYDGRNMRTSETSYQRAYVVWATFKSQYLTLSGMVKLASDSPSSTGQGDIRIYHMSYGQPIATQRFSLEKSYNQDYNEDLYWQMQIDLKDYFSGNPGGATYPGYPDKRKINLYVEIRMVNKGNPDDAMDMRVNRGWMDG
ncbi:phage tail protein [Salinicoccus roseus]|uniref:Tail spike domain-containing protein n=1 Tax=Salinicoccus roseus TaxID=45670 RepID=A0A265E683_9STAP|nr:phage tail protein [Salinicoccus roseus]OZT77104.1 hypothetical protein CFN03_08490 [Salinicoccus roseus]